MMENSREHFTARLMVAILALSLFAGGSHVGWCIDKGDAHVAGNEHDVFYDCHSAPVSSQDYHTSVIELEMHRGKQCLDVASASAMYITPRSRNGHEASKASIVPIMMPFDVDLREDLFRLSNNQLDQSFQTTPQRSLRTIVLLS